MQTDVVKYRLGLDLGTNSLGWAAVKLGDDGEPYGLLDLGVRIFPDGRNERSEASNAVERRTARGQRRLRDRYLQRRGGLMQAMVAWGLMPEDETERKSLENGDPYRLRARALDERLVPFELGRALFHLAQRRGFKSNRKVPGGDEAEGGKIATDIDTLQQRITASGARTLGEFLHRRRKRGENVLARPGQGLYPNRAAWFFLHLDPVDLDDLPARRQHGFDNLDFAFDDHGAVFDGRCTAVRSLPEYDITRIGTGQYLRVLGGYKNLWEGEFRLVE